MLEEKRNVRMIDIAQEVGVSKSAVARVLTNGGVNSIRVSEETRRKIQEVAKRLNYTPNTAARALAGKGSMVIGVLIDSCAPRSIYQILSVIEEKAAESGYRLMIGQSHDNVDNMFECYRNFIRHKIDGVICLAHEYPGSEKKIRSYFDKRQNLVFIGKPCLDCRSYIEINRQNGIRQAVSHLVKEGYRRIGLLIFPFSHNSLQQRQDGYREGIGDSGLTFNPDFISMVQQYPDAASIRAQMKDYVDSEILPKRLDAVIAVNDIYASHLLRELLTRGIKVPQEIAIVGHDNDDFTEFSYPTLTTIDQSPRAVGEAAFHMLLTGLEQPGRSVAPQTINTELIIRESSNRSKFNDINAITR